MFCNSIITSYVYQFLQYFISESQINLLINIVTQDIDIIIVSLRPYELFLSSSSVCCLYDCVCVVWTTQTQSQRQESNMISYLERTDIHLFSNSINFILNKILSWIIIIVLTVNPLYVKTFRLIFFNSRFCKLVKQ